MPYVLMTCYAMATELFCMHLRTLSLRTSGVHMLFVARIY